MTLFPSNPPAYTRFHPFGIGSKTSVNLPTWLVHQFSSEATRQVLAIVYYQDRTKRRDKPYTYRDISIRTGLCRNTVAWALWEIHQINMIIKEIHKNESYWQMVGKAHARRKKLCKRNRSVSHINFALIKERNAEEARKRKAKEREKKKLEKSERMNVLKELRTEAILPTPLKNPPTIFNSDKRSEPQVTPTLKVLEALFEENKIRSYKMDGDLRCRHYMSKTLKRIKMADFLLAVALFTQNRFLMDANANGWLVARANALRNEEQEPWTNGKILNGYKNWCPSMVWFVRNIHKILAGDYAYKNQEQRMREKEQRQLEFNLQPPTPQPSIKSFVEDLALIERKRIEKEYEEKMELQVRLDRESAHRAKSYWNDLKAEDRHKLETQFIEAIKKGETSFSPQTNMADRFFKIMKESMLLTWLGYQLKDSHPFPTCKDFPH